MGKNLKGRECGKGIYQRKDGKYSARYCARNGTRQEKYFDTLPEARNWLADAKYEDRHGIVVTTSEMTVDEWFDYWMNNLICDLSPNTKRNYEERYKHNIQSVIGKMCISDVKPMHCKAVLNRIETNYAGSTIRQTYIAMGTPSTGKSIRWPLVNPYTYATRAIDDGIQPKVLQQLLGHASIKTTMDRYVHVTNESLVNAVQCGLRQNSMKKWRTET